MHHSKLRNIFYINFLDIKINFEYTQVVTRNTFSHIGRYSFDKQAFFHVFKLYSTIENK